MKAYERLLKYVKIWTTSDEECDNTPSTKRQFELADILVKELENMGVKVKVDDKCYVYGYIPATKGYEDRKSIGFIAHLDTAPDYNGQKVSPQIIDNYDGKDIILKSDNKVISVKDFPHLKEWAGRSIIVTDGSTLLGADDKAGVAEIMTAVEEIIESNMPHGKICIGFTPDEEIGRGADFFDIKEFGADVAYTVDGGIEGELQYENFNAASAKLEIKGVSVHPGEACGIMVNAALVAMQINSMLPETMIPARTKDREGFYHLTDMSGNVERASLAYIIRDHDRNLFEEKKRVLKVICDNVNNQYGKQTVELTIKDSYYNMREIVEKQMDVIECAKKAISEAGVEVRIEPIRGGTDGARLSYMGLVCPNLGTGGQGFHGPLEHISIEGMEASVNIIKNLVRIYANE